MQESFVNLNQTQLEAVTATEGYIRALRERVPVRHAR